MPPAHPPDVVRLLDRSGHDKRPVSLDEVFRGRRGPLVQGREPVGPVWPVSLELREVEEFSATKEVSRFHGLDCRMDYEPVENLLGARGELRSPVGQHQRRRFMGGESLGVVPIIQGPQAQRRCAARGTEGGLNTSTLTT